MTDNKFNLAATRRDLRRLGRIEGWLAPFSAEVIVTLGRAQCEFVNGAIVEIGVHHGKLFFAMCLSQQPGDKALAIDLFDCQQMNVDHSGKGDKSVFLTHADRIMPHRHALQLIEGSSLDMRPDDIVSCVGRVRLFSIDGGHTREATLNDLRLAEATLADEGLVVLDDVFNEFWPEVMAGFTDYLKDGGLTPFAITPGKVYLCRPAVRTKYLTVLRAAFPLRLDKMAGIMGHEAQILGISAWTLRRAFGATALGRLIKQMRSFLRSDAQAHKLP